MRSALFAVLFCFFSVRPAAGEVVSASPGAFLLQAEAEVAATPEATWQALLQLPRWWSSAHTYSGDARRMRLDPRAGGCWCERWDGHSVEHGRVILAMQHDGVRTLRLNAALGPLQELGVTGILTFTIRPHAAGASIAVTYRVSGEPGLALDGIAPLVDMVIMEQFARLGRYAATGSPE